MLVDAGYGVNGRPVILRTFLSRIDNLVYARSALEDHPFHSPYFRLHLLYNDDEASTVTGFQTLIEDAADEGYDGVEFNLGTANLFSLVHRSETLGLGVALWTVPESMGEIYCTGLREEVDVLITDYPIDDCIQVATEDTQILYLDVSQQSASASRLDYAYDGSDSGSISVGGSGEPYLASSSSGVLTGSYLDFNSTVEESLAFHDGDNDPDEGYFLVAIFRPDLLSGSSWETQAIVSKADSGAFALELDQSSSVLRFGVRVDGSYEYATLSTGQLSTDQLHMVMGAYDGNGKVRLWLDASDSWVDESGSLSDGVDSNDVPIRIGADPEGSSGSRYHFDGAIQMISVHRWRNH